MDTERRNLLGWFAAGACPVGTLPGAHAQPRPGVSPFASPLPLPVARYTVGKPGTADLSVAFTAPSNESLRLRLRANLAPRDATPPAAVAADTQYPELALEGSRLRFDGSGAGAVTAGASATRVQIEATASGFDDPATVTVSDIAVIVVDSPLSILRHGLDSWPTFDALARAVQGDAPPGSAPRGRTDLIGQVFQLTPGMFSEGINGRGAAPSPVAVVHFPCTIKALDASRRPVFRSVTGTRDIIQIDAQHFVPIEGEVVLQDLVIRDNRSWYDTGEAGVRIKDRFPGRSVRIERCEFVRCQNAVSGGALGQTLRIADCRVVDCGLGTQAHAFYVQPEWLEFEGNLVMQSPGNRLAQAHLLKTRALNGRVHGNRFELIDCPGSYLIDISNGGHYDIAGNEFRYGRLSDNSVATLIAYAPEGAGADHGRPPYSFSPGRSFRLTVRNNTLHSDFPGRTVFVAITDQVAPRAEGGEAASYPQPVVIADNVCRHSGPGQLVLRRDRRSGLSRDVDESGAFPHNAMNVASRGAAPNAAGPYAARRFAPRGLLGTGSAPQTFTRQGA